jgi:hypothetical protein
MTNAIIADAEALVEKIKAEFSPAVKIAENDAHDIVSKAWTYIKTNGLEDAYQIALTIVGGAVAGTPWVTTLAAVEAAVVEGGKAIEKGAVAVVAAQAQADLISVGTLLPPVATAS